MNFPRLKDFKFDINNTYAIPATKTGRADLIAIDIYNNFRFYKPLCEANNINLPYGLRPGIRTIQQSILLEAKLDGLTADQTNALIEESYNNFVPGDLDWNNFGDTFTGFISDLYEGRLLLVPSSDNCVEWLSRYSTITNNS